MKMSKFLITILLMLFLFNIGIAQDSIERVMLTPYIEWLTKEEKRLKKRLTEHSVIGYFKPPRIRVNFAIEQKTFEDCENCAVIVVDTNIGELVFSDNYSTPQARINYFLRITSKDRSIDGVIEEDSTVSVDKEKLADGNSNELPVIYRRIISLPKGRYVANFRFRDNESEGRAKKTIQFEIK
jgi:hypothetical protein